MCKSSGTLRGSSSLSLYDRSVEMCMCVRAGKRAEQNRGGSSWLPQAKAASAAGTLAAENISIGAARVFEVHRSWSEYRYSTPWRSLGSQPEGNVSQDAERYPRTISKISIGGDCSWLPLFFPRKRVTMFLKIFVKFYRENVLVWNIE